MFESLKKLTNYQQVTNSSEINDIMSSLPVTENVSGLSVGETITEIGEFAIIQPNIRGVVQRATVVLQAKVANAKGEERERPVYLSSLIRKINLNDPFKGMIAEGPEFKNHSNFSNKQWYEAFKAACPFNVAALNQQPREIRTADGPQQIQVRELLLEAGWHKDATQPEAGGTTASGGKKGGPKASNAGK